MDEPNVVDVGLVLGIDLGYERRGLKTEDHLTPTRLFAEAYEHEEGEQSDIHVAPCPASEEMVVAARRLHVEPREPDCREKDALVLLKRIEKRFAKESIAVSCGVVARDPTTRIEDVMREADRRMYEVKTRRQNGSESLDVVSLRPMGEHQSRALPGCLAGIICRGLRLAGKSCRGSDE